MAIDTLAARESALLDVMITPGDGIDQYDFPPLLGQYRFAAPTPDPTVGISPTWRNSLYKPAHYAPLRYQPARWKPTRYRKPF